MSVKSFDLQAQFPANAQRRANRAGKQGPHTFEPLTAKPKLTAPTCKDFLQVASHGFQRASFPIPRLFQGNSRNVPGNASSEHVTI